MIHEEETSERTTSQQQHPHAGATRQTAHTPAVHLIQPHAASSSDGRDRQPPRNLAPTCWTPGCRPWPTWSSATFSASRATKRSWMPACTRRRLGLTQVCPALRNLPFGDGWLDGRMVRLVRRGYVGGSGQVAVAFRQSCQPVHDPIPHLHHLPAMTPLTAFSRSASSKTRTGAFPPSSSEIFLTVEAQSRMRTLPTAVDPVKDTLRTCLFFFWGGGGRSNVCM